MCPCCTGPKPFTLASIEARQQAWLAHQCPPELPPHTEVLEARPVGDNHEPNSTLATNARARYVSGAARTKSVPFSVRFWPLRRKSRIIGYSDASYRNMRTSHPIEHMSFSCTDNETHKITATTMSTTVAELRGRMRCTFHHFVFVVLVR